MKKDVDDLKKMMVILNGNMGTIEKGTQMVTDNMHLLDDAKKTLDSKLDPVLAKVSQATKLTQGIQTKVESGERRLLEAFPDAKQYIE